MKVYSEPDAENMQALNTRCKCGEALRHATSLFGGRARSASPLGRRPDLNERQPVQKFARESRL